MRSYFTPLKKSFFPLIIIVVFTIFSFVLFKRYSERFGVFGCFDECFNYVGAYFILKGRVLYKEIFFNHQMLLAYISMLIQKFLHPLDIYHLVLYHRMFVLFFGLIMDTLLMLRFRFVGTGFVFLFEATKFYFMGSLFLPESLLVYPLVYLFGLSWQRLLGSKLFVLDYFLSALFAWFIIFSREPFVPLALLLFFVILFQKNIHKMQVFSFLLFLLLSGFVLVFTSLPDFFFQVVSVNAKTVSLDLFRTVFYPFVILFEGKQTFVREILVALDSIFLISLLTFILKGKKKYLAVVLFLILGLANLRVVSPGIMFYEAFHMLPWYGLFIFATGLLLESLYITAQMKKFTFFLSALVTFTIIYAIFSPKSFLWEQVNKDEEFHRNFDHYYILGEAIRKLSKTDDTLFLEQWDDLIYWQSGLNSSYVYAIYGNGGNSFPRFKEARTSMFQNKPPDFYYSPCDKGMYLFGFLPKPRIKEYVQLQYVDEPSCLFVKTKKLSEISVNQWEKLKVLRFSLPDGL